MKEQPGVIQKKNYAKKPVRKDVVKYFSIRAVDECNTQSDENVAANILKEI